MIETGSGELVPIAGVSGYEGDLKNKASLLNNGTAFLSQDSQEHLRAAQWPVLKSIEDYIISRPPEAVKGYVKAPTGSGKTVIFDRLLQDLKSQDRLPRTLIVEPTNQLKAQTINSLKQHGFKGSVSEVVGWQKDNGQDDVRVVTQSSFAKNLLRPSQYVIDPTKYGLIIFDEAHHLQGPQTQIAIKRHFDKVMKIGFSATPDYDEERQLKTVLPDLIHEITPEEAVAEGLTSPFTTILLSTHTDMSDVRVVGKGAFSSEDLEQILNTDLRNFAIARFYTDTSLRDKKAIFNTSTISHAEAMAEALRSYGVPAEAIHGKLSKNRQQKLIKAMSDGELTVLTQAKLLREGYDEPSIEVVVNVDPTLSQLQTVQRTGRGQRTDPNNPDKNLIVVECMDYNYRRQPVFYGDERAVGRWSIAPGGLKTETFVLLNEIANYQMDGLVCITDQESIPAWYHRLERDDPRLQTLATTALSEDIVYDHDHQPFELPEYLLRDDRRPRLDRSSVPVVDLDGNIVGDNNEAISLKVDAPAVDHKYFERPTTSTQNLGSVDIPQQEVPTSVLSDWNMLTKPSEQALGNFVLNGELDPGVEISNFDTRRVRQVFAGKTELSDPSVLYRFQLLNQLAAGKIDLSTVPTYSEQVEVDNSTKSEGKHKNLSRNIEVFEVDEFDEEEAACGPDVAQPDYIVDSDDPFFPGRGESTTDAKALCLGCVVLDDCLKFAVDNGIKHGIWGGMSERQRRMVRRAQNTQSVEAAQQTIKIEHSRNLDTVQNVLFVRQGRSAVDAFLGDYSQAEKRREERRSARADN